MTPDRKVLDQVLVPEALGEKDIVVVPSSILFAEGEWNGVKEMDEQSLFELLSSHMEFRERSEELERDRSVRQIIPYFLVTSGDKYFSAQRKSDEKRLDEYRIIGFGGHLKAGDIKGTMGTWLEREFSEEISGVEIRELEFIGVLNADSDEDDGVHRVHTGLVFRMEVDGDPQINPEERGKFKNEQMLTFRELSDRQGEMELWSKLLTDYLKEKQV